MFRSQDCQLRPGGREQDEDRLIRDGMGFAGALDFSMSPPTRDFRRDDGHKHAFGQATLTRLEP